MNIPFVGFKKAGCEFELMSLEKFYLKGLDYVPRPDTYHRVGFHCLFLSDIAGTHQIDFAPYDYQQGDLVYIAAGQVHAYDFSQPLSGRMLLFTPAYYLSLRAILPTDCLWLLGRNPVITPDSDMLEQIEHCLALMGIQQRLQLPERNRQFTLANLLLTLSEGRFAEQAEPGPLLAYQQLLGLIQCHCSETRHAVDYCRMMSMGFTKLNGICVKVSGFTLKRVIDHQVVLEAKRRLATEPLNISQLSDRLGFDEVTNFSKYFKKHTGITPKQFREVGRYDLPFLDNLLPV